MQELKHLNNWPRFNAKPAVNKWTKAPAVYTVILMSNLLD